ncbi:hypothetical protein GCM10011380_27200 [Sphingomonas metalli]|uniref:DUF4175 domain-containing protein n=1 Tax=Sphingomonas metalli TaxID=1779358 RepID=A0A916WX04_9SPHN|nr:DUF4175 family protein [Sphingomonas metalli]GGB36365.1 hypothetical protein GCM10011380_27200 [Sphingomonas metalli]
MEDVGRWAASARRRARLADVATGAPLVLVAALGTARLLSWMAGAIVGLGLALGLAWLAMHRAQRFGRAWLVRALDAARGDLEDSSDLLFAEDAKLGPLQRLQRARVGARLAAAPVPDLGPAWPTRPIVAAWILAAIALMALLLWPAPRPGVALAPAQEGGPARPGVPRLVGQRLTVVPPAYTGLPPRPLDLLDARVPQGSRLRWELQFSPEPEAARIVAPGGGDLPLRRAGDRWTGEKAADRSFLYRVTAAGMDARAAPPLHRIDVVADQPPRIRVVAPSRTLSMVTRGQRSWALRFDVSDDYGVAPVARLRLVLAQGEGENVAFRERMLTLTGSGPASRRSFATQIDLAAAGFSEAGDLVAQLIVADNRAPQPQIVRGASLILRRPPAALAESGVEASVRRVMPAYFRSQRQIIIDAEALIRERPRLAADRFLSRSDGIGADQRLLRLRYGQFMGEETGGGATNAMPTNDEEDAAAKPAAPGDEHAGEAPAPPAAFGAAGDVTAEYGHTHDESEAATLLDPGTRATLRQALDAMWQSELALRQGDPKQALVPAYRALRFIKQVQQATRIFLARTGTQLPPIDEGRRLTGKRDGIERPALPPLAPGLTPDAAPVASWQALAGGGDARLGALSQWLAGRGGRIRDPLAIAAAVDAVRRDPGCGACRQRLRGLLWSVLVRPAPGVQRRDAGDAMARRYAEALR